MSDGTFIWIVVGILVAAIGWALYDDLPPRPPRNLR